MEYTASLLFYKVLSRCALHKHHPLSIGKETFVYTRNTPKIRSKLGVLSQVLSQVCICVYDRVRARKVWHLTSLVNNFKQGDLGKLLGVCSAAYVSMEMLAA